MDMEQHLQANNIRINILEQENAMLHRSIEKLGERIEQNAQKVIKFWCKNVTIKSPCTN